MLKTSQSTWTKFSFFKLLNEQSPYLQPLHPKRVIHWTLVQEVFYISLKTPVIYKKHWSTKLWAINLISLQPFLLYKVLIHDFCLILYNVSSKIYYSFLNLSFYSNLPYSSRVYWEMVIQSINSNTPYLPHSTVFSGFLKCLPILLFLQYQASISSFLINAMIWMRSSQILILKSWTPKWWY